MAVNLRSAQTSVNVMKNLRIHDGEGREGRIKIIQLCGDGIFNLVYSGLILPTSGLYLKLEYAENVMEKVYHARW